jgi:hypothetical protein
VPLTVALNFDLQNAQHRRVAEWLSAQSDPVEALARLLSATDEGARRVAQWEELIQLLGKETREMGSAWRICRPSSAKAPEDPESAQRLDSCSASVARQGRPRVDPYNSLERFIQYTWQQHVTDGSR